MISFWTLGSWVLMLASPTWPSSYLYIYTQKKSLHMLLIIQYIVWLCERIKVFFCTTRWYKEINCQINEVYYYLILSKKRHNTVNTNLSFSFQHPSLTNHLVFIPRTSTISSGWENTIPRRAKVQKQITFGCDLNLIAVHLKAGTRSPGISSQRRCRVLPVGLRTQL